MIAGVFIPGAVTVGIGAGLVMADVVVGQLVQVS